MNRRHLLSLMLFLFACLGLGRATNVYIGSDWESTNYSGIHPLNVSRNYSLTQQIYAYHEIGMAGTIYSISFYNLSNYSFALQNLQVFIKTTDKDEFISKNDVVPFSASDKVYEGVFAGTGSDWATITLDTPFEYNGESNLLICFYDPDPDFDTSPHFQTTATSYYLSLSHCHDTEVPDLNNLYGYNGFKYRYKERNNIRFGIMPNNFGSLTVYDGTAITNYVPAYIYYFDEFTRSQFVIPAEELVEMAGLPISSMTFYTDSDYVPYTTVSSADVYLKEVSYTSISAFEPKASATTVYSGYFDIERTDSGGKLTINFSTPYTYNGGNLLVGIENTDDIDFKRIFFYGQNVTGASIAGSDLTSLENVQPTQRNFIPKTTFNYTPAGGECEASAFLKTNQLNYNSAELEWESVQNAGYWVEYKQKGGEWIQKNDSPMGQGCTIGNLTENTTYYVRVRAQCVNGGYTSWTTRHFTTPSACHVPYNVHLRQLTDNDAWISWDIDVNDPNHIGHSYQYKESSSNEWTNLCPTDNCGVGTIITPLDPETSYNFRVRQNCNNGHESEWVNFDFTTLHTPMTVPFTEPFTDGILDYWTDYNGLMADVLNGIATLSSGNKWTSHSTNNGVFDSHACLNIYGSNKATNWLVTPLVEIQDNNYQLSFDVALTKYSGIQQPVTPGGQPDDKFVVLISTNGGVDWTILREWNNTGSEYVYDNIATTGETIQIDISDYYSPFIGTAYVRIAFYGESTVSNGDNNLHIDNVKIEEIDPCAAPYNVTIRSTTPHGFNASFIPGAVTQTQWFFDYTTTNTTPPTSATGNTTDTSFGVSNLSSLNSNTTYYLWMGTYCEEDDTYHWSEPAAFTTTAACPKVYTQDIEIEDIQPHSVSLSWEAYQGISSGWQVYYSMYDGLSTNEEYINEVAYFTNDPYVTIEELFGDYEYHFWIRSYCGDWYGTPQWSPWSDMITVHTLVSCPQPTNLEAYTTANSATITWDRGQASHWTVEIVSDDWGDYPPYFEVDVPSITFDEEFLNGLVEDGDCYKKNYTVYVYAECGEEDGTSEAAVLDFVVTDKQSLTVYDGTATNNRIPAYIYYFDYLTKSQFVIPADDLVKMIGTPITSMTFYTTSSNIPYPASDAIPAPVDVYLYEVSDTSISEFQPKANGTIVYHGTLTVEASDSGGLLTIQFSTPYYYNGGNLLVGIENTDDEDYQNIYFYGQTVDGASISGSNSSGTGTIPAEQQNFIPKTTFGFTQNCAPYPLPYYYGFENANELGCWTMLNCHENTAISSNDAHTDNYSFRFRWNTTPPQYLISPQFEGTTGMNVSFYYKNASDNYPETFQVGYSTTTKSPNAFIWGDEITADDENSWEYYENFFPEGTKYVAVKLTSNDMYYFYLDDFSFEPADCAPEDKCQLTFELTDSYGDGWDGNAINVVDVLTGEVLASFSNVTNDHAHAPITENYHLSVCDGRNLRFEWVSGSWISECSYVVYDINNDVVFSGSGAMSEPFNYTMDCTQKYIFIADGDWNDSGNWNIGMVPPSGRDVIIRADVTIPSGYTAVSNTISLEGGSITIADGGQLRHNTSGLLVTMKKNIVGYDDANSQRNYYLLANPFDDDIPVPVEMTAEGCDLYMFNEDYPNAEWRNNKQTPVNVLQPLEGYLFASPVSFELSLTGTSMRSVSYYFPNWSYSENPNNISNGWYLLGNFYTSNAYIYTKNENDEYVPMNVMVYNEEGEMETRLAGPIPPMGAYFIKLTETTTIYFKSAPSAPIIPTGAIEGKFSVNGNGDQVYFSQGNLQYIGSADTPYWKFAENQWDVLGDNGQGSTNQYVDRDLLGWGTSGYDHGAVSYQPWSTSSTDHDYWPYGDSQANLNDQNGKANWGYNAISNGCNIKNLGWRALTRNEWEYVFNTRQTESGIRYAKATVNGVKGMVLFPDNWNPEFYNPSNANSNTTDFSSNILSAAQWNNIEPLGVVFLPEGGWRNGTSIDSTYDYGSYWSSSCSASHDAGCVNFNDGYFSPRDTNPRHYGLSVRLVYPVLK